MGDSYVTMSKGHWMKGLGLRREAHLRYRIEKIKS